ncbi:MAG: heavy-metal-associated domain-containing protein [Mycobacteriales bacterium]
MTTATIEVTGMHCASCGLLVDDAAEDVAGVRSSQTDVRRGRTTVEYDPAKTSPELVAAAITAETGYRAEPGAPLPTGK